MTTSTTNTDQQVAQSETLEWIATRVVNQIAVGAWQYCSRQWVIGLVTEALRNERERCAKVADGWANSNSCDAHDVNPCCHVRTGVAISEAIRKGA